MAHHGSRPLDGGNQEDDRERQMNELRRALLDTTGFVGATGMFPQGQLTPNDEGQIRFVMKAENGKVVLDFGTPVVWIGMTPQEACDLAGDLVKFARAVARENGEMVALTIR